MPTSHASTVGAQPGAGRAAPFRRVTLVDVAQVAGVSPATVSRALKDDPRISVATRETVAHAAEQLGYIPNEAARSLVLRATRTLGLVVPDVTDPLHGQVIAGFEQEAALRGYGVSVANGLSDADRERRILQVFTAQRAHGVALFGSVLSQRQVLDAVRPTPVVFVGGEHLSLAGNRNDLMLGCIRADEERGVEALVQHLAQQGCRRFGYVHGPSVASNITRRNAATRAVTRAAREHPVTSTLRQYPALPLGWRSGPRLAERIAQDRERPDALLCYDDKLALAMMDALRSAELSVPGDLAVAGFDDIPFARLSNPRLTTVAQPSTQMGRLAASMLLEAAESGVVPASVLLPVEVVVRESSRRSAFVIDGRPAERARSGREAQPGQRQNA